MLCVAASGFGLLYALVDVRTLYQRIVLAVVVGLSIYATKKAANCVTAMQDLVYQKAVFEFHQRRSGGQVQPLRRSD